MPTTPSTRKPLRMLTRADLQAFPIWEWAVNEEGAECHDTSIVRPTQHAAVPVDVAGQFIVAASADLRNGASIPALVEVTVKGKRRRFEPLGVLVMDRHLDFVGADAIRIISHYTKTENNYPVRWQLAVAIGGETRLRDAPVSSGALSWLAGLLRRSKREKAPSRLSELAS